MAKSSLSAIDACRTIYENEEAEKSGAAKSDSLRERLDYYDRIHRSGNPGL